MPSRNLWPARLVETDHFGGFGLYVHWPFCKAKCPYCDFNSHVWARVDHDQWCRELVRGLTGLHNRIGRRPFDSIFFGGGTPSLMDPGTVQQVIETADNLFGVAEGAEITLEANPTSVEAGLLADMKTAGVSRISLGIQALDDVSLKRLGRLHSAAEAMAALEVARELFESVSFDLIYARQYQTPPEWEEELSRALALAPDHLSLYQLTIEPDTAFGARAARGSLPGLPDEDRAAEMYEITQHRCRDAGLPAYEVSNHARPGHESVHNLIYWRGGEFAGIGPGAHGRLRIGGRLYATEETRDPAEWLKSGHDRMAWEPISEPEAAEEYLMMALRLVEGMSAARYAKLGGRIDPDHANELAEQGLLRIEGDRIAATDAGRAVLNSVILFLLER